MSMFSDYIKERGVLNILETDKGFATYKIVGTECYIEDIYVIPEYRRGKAGSDLANEIVEAAKAKGCRYLTGSVVPSAKGSTESCKALLAYGFRLLRANENVIYFVKEI